MIRADKGLALDDVESRGPDPLFAQRVRKRVRVYDRAPRDVDEHRVFLHLAEKGGVD